MSEWKEIKLEDFAEVNPTERLPKGTLAKKIAMEVLQPFTKKISSFSVEEYKGGVKFRNGDTIMARITPSLENGKTSFVDILDEDEIAFGSTEFIALREKSNISDKHFIYYLTTSPIIRNTAIKSMTGSSGRQRVQTNVVKEHLFDAPPLPEQKAIAEVLSSLDDKIDLLHRQNKTLEAMAETLFRQWFVEEAKEEWEEYEIGKKLKVLLGGTPSTKRNEYWNGAIPWINSGEINKFRILEPSKYITKLGLDNSSTKLLPKGTTVIAITGATLGQVSKLEIDSCANQSVIGIIGNHEFSDEFIYLWIKHFIKEIISNQTGGAQQHINANDVKKTIIVKPDEKSYKNFEDTIKPIFNKISNNSFQIKTHENLRDTLLPKLMSGEVRLRI